jgi:hypothetical protein
MEASSMALVYAKRHLRLPPTLKEASVVPYHPIDVVSDLECDTLHVDARFGRVSAGRSTALVG